MLVFQHGNFTYPAKQDAHWVANNNKKQKIITYSRRIVWNTSYWNHLALSKSRVNNGGKQFTSTINLGNEVNAAVEPILLSEITIFTKFVDKRL